MKKLGKKELHRVRLFRLMLVVARSVPAKVVQLQL